MSSLSVYHVSSPEIPNKVLTHLEDIASTLAEQGVRFDRWQATAKIQPGATQEEVISAYKEQIDKLMTERGYVTVDVISLNSDHPQKAELRAKFLKNTARRSRVKIFRRRCGRLPCTSTLRLRRACEKNDLIWYTPAPSTGRHGEHRTVSRLACSTTRTMGTNCTGEDIAGDSALGTENMSIKSSSPTSKAHQRRQSFSTGFSVAANTCGLRAPPQSVTMARAARRSTCAATNRRPR